MSRIRNGTTRSLKTSGTWITVDQPEVPSEPFIRGYQAALRDAWDTVERPEASDAPGGDTDAVTKRGWQHQRHDNAAGDPRSAGPPQPGTVDSHGPTTLKATRGPGTPQPDPHIPGPGLKEYSMTISTTTRTISCPRCGGQFELGEAYVTSSSPRYALSGRSRPASRSWPRSALERDELQADSPSRRPGSRPCAPQEAELLRDRRKLEDEREDLERTKERMRDEIRTQERADADQRAQETSRNSCAARTRRPGSWKISSSESGNSWRKHSAEAGPAHRNRRASRGRPVAEELQRRNPGDLITVTPRGKRGADVTQVVRAGILDCGVIKWECKRTATWNAEWSGKLADDVAAAGPSSA